MIHFKMIFFLQKKGQFVSVWLCSTKLMSDISYKKMKLKRLSAILAIFSQPERVQPR